MNRNQAKELLSIIKAFSEGKVIQSRHIKGGASLWYDVETPNFDNNDFDYRIKPEPKYRSFANAEECLQEMLKHQQFGWIKAKEGVYFNIIYVDDYYAGFADKDGSAILLASKNSYQDNTFIDGTPFGVKVEE